MSEYQYYEFLAIDRPLEALRQAQAKKPSFIERLRKAAL